MVVELAAPPALSLLDGNDEGAWLLLLAADSVLALAVTATVSMVLPWWTDAGLTTENCE